MADYLQKSISIAREINTKDIIREIYVVMAKMYSLQGNYKLAYEYHIKYSAIKDTLLNEESLSQINEMQTKYETEKKDKELVLKNAEIKQKKLESEKEQVLRYTLYVGLLLTLVFGVFIFNRFRVTQKQKKIIEIQKHQVEIQKEMVEEKQNEILDSIHYAKRIQKSMLTNEKHIEKELNRLKKNNFL